MKVSVGDSRPRLSSRATARRCFSIGAKHQSELCSTGQMRTSAPTWFVVGLHERGRSRPHQSFCATLRQIFSVISLFMSRGHTDEASAQAGLRHRCARLRYRLSAHPLRARKHASLRPITVDDYFQVREVDDPQISADGQWVAYTVSTSSLKDDEDKTRIWMAPTAGGDAIPLTSGRGLIRASALEPGRQVSRISFQAR